MTIVDVSGVVADLPQFVRSLNDVRKLLRKYKVETSFSQRDIQRALNATRRDERLYFVVPATMIQITSLDGQQISSGSGTGAACLSDKRFFCVEGTDVHEFPNGEIHSVASSQSLKFNGVSFCTTTHRVEIESNAEIDKHLNVLRDVLVHVLANSQQLETTSSHSSPQPAAMQRPRVVECRGCAATLIFYPNTINRCEYCGRHAD